MAGLKAPSFSGSGDASGEVELNSEIFGVEPNHALMHQVVTAQLAGARAGTHKTKTRAEVRAVAPSPGGRREPVGPGMAPFAAPSGAAVGWPMARLRATTANAPPKR